MEISFLLSGLLSRRTMPRVEGAGLVKEAYAKMEQAETEGILKAHQAQTLVIQEEARGLAHAPSLLFTHAQDHLMTTMCEVSQIRRLIELYELIVGPQ